MSYIYHGKKGWIKQPNRNFKTWESGLCMVQEQYICRADDVDYSAFQLGDPIENSEPCIDGAFIYPEPVYENLGNGFVQATVTAYGRVNNSGCYSSILTKLTRDFRIIEYYQDPAEPNYEYLQRGPYYLDYYVNTPILKIVYPREELPLSVNPYPFASYTNLSGEKLNLVFPMDFNLSINPSAYHGWFEGDEFVKDLRITRFDSVNFGAFTEYTIQWTEANSNQILPPSFDASIGYQEVYYKKAAPIFQPFGDPENPFSIADFGSTTRFRVRTFNVPPLNNAEYLIINCADYGLIDYIVSGTFWESTMPSAAPGTYILDVQAVNEYGVIRKTQEFVI
jgi:hypothetical protein